MGNYNIVTTVCFSFPYKISSISSISNRGGGETGPGRKDESSEAILPEWEAPQRTT